MNCEKTKAAFVTELVIIHTLIIATIALIISAIAANASFFGAVTSPASMAGAAALIATGLGFVVALATAVNLIALQCSTRNGLVICEYLRKRLVTAIGVLIAAMAAHALASLAAIFWGAIPWVGGVVMTVVVAAVTLELGMLVAIDTAYARWVACLATNQTGVRTIPLVVKGVNVETCPLNKAECKDSELQQATQSDGGTFIAAKSFVVLVSTSQTASSVTAKVADSSSNSVNIDQADIHQPNSHSIKDPSMWAIRVNWTKMSNGGLTAGATASDRTWTLDVELKLTNGTTESIQFRVQVSN